jgi:Tfp pilus assembly protein PilX
MTMTLAVRSKQRRRRGVTGYAAVLTITLLVILSYSILHQALMDYRFSALVRDQIVLQQLTDSAVAQAVYYLNEGDREKAAATVSEPFGIARIEIAGQGESQVLRITVHVPNEEYPRSSGRTAVLLARDAEGRWHVESAAGEPVPMGK